MQPYDPTLGTLPTDNAVPLDQFTATFDDAIKTADQQLAAAKQRAGDAATRLANIPAGLVNDDDRKAAEAELAKASTVVQQASGDVVEAHKSKAAAIERYAQRGNISPALQQRYSAMAATESANAQKVLAENAEFLNAIPEKRDQLHSATLTAQAQADLARAQADVAGATTPQQIQQANASLALAQQNVKNAAANEASIRAGTGATIAQTAQTGAQTDLVRQQVRTATAQADVAPAAAQAAVDQAQAGVNKSNLEIAALQQQLRQAPTDSQAAQAIQTQLDQKQTELASAQQQLKAAQQLLPINVAQGNANVAATQAGTAATQANTQKDLLGNLYGFQDKIKAISDALRSGAMQPDQANSMLNDFISSTIQGTTPFDRNRLLLEQESTRRGQDYSLAGQQMSTLGSGFSNALSTFSKLNDTTPVGSNSAGQGFLAAFHMLGDQLGGLRPQASSPLLNSMMAQSQSQPAGGGSAVAAPPAPNAASMLPPSAVAPAPGGGGPGHTITINIGGAGGDQSQPTPPSYNYTPETSDQSAARNAPAMLDAGAPVMPNHVQDLWANDPNLHPELAGG